MSDLIEVRISRLERFNVSDDRATSAGLIAVTQYSLIHDPGDNIERTF
jgi:hypothetical protein